MSATVRIRCSSYIWNIPSIYYFIFFSSSSSYIFLFVRVYMCMYEFFSAYVYLSINLSFLPPSFSLFLSLRISFLLSLTLSLTLSHTFSLTTPFSLSLLYCLTLFYSVTSLTPSWLTSMKAMAHLNQLIQEEKNKIKVQGLCHSGNTYSIKNILLSLDQITPIVKELQVNWYSSFFDFFDLYLFIY